MLKMMIVLANFCRFIGNLRMNYGHFIGIFYRIGVIYENRKTNLTPAKFFNLSLWKFSQKNSIFHHFIFNIKFQPLSITNPTKSHQKHQNKLSFLHLRNFLSYFFLSPLKFYWSVHAHSSPLPFIFLSSKKDVSCCVFSFLGSSVIQHI